MNFELKEACVKNQLSIKEQDAKSLQSCKIILPEPVGLI